MNWYVERPGRVVPKKGFGYLLLLAKVENCVFTSSRSRLGKTIRNFVLEPRCDRAAWVRSRFEPQELIDVQLERQLATHYRYRCRYRFYPLSLEQEFYSIFRCNKPE